MRDKRISADLVAAEVRDGMTLGIGGWGSRRKPMALVHAILRRGAKDLTVVSYGGPDVGMLCAAGRVAKVITGFVSLDSIPLDPHYRTARQAGGIEAVELDEGMLQWGLYAASLRLPFLPTRAGLGSDVLALCPHLRTVKSPYDDGEDLVAVPAIHLDVAICHLNRADAAGNAQFLGPDLYFDDLFLGAAKRRFISVEQIVPTAELARLGSIQTMKIHRGLVDGVVDAPKGAHFTECLPDYGRDEEAQARYAGGARVVKHEVCIVALAEAFRGDGEILASGIGVLPSIAARLARATFAPDLMLTDGVATLVEADGALAGWMPYRAIFDLVWSGRRHVIMGASQIDRFGNQNIACIGDPRKPKAQLLGMRGAPGNTINHPTSYWIPSHTRRSFVPRVDVVSGVGYDRAAALGVAARFHEIRRVVTDLAVLDFATPDHAMRLASLHPGVALADVVERTGFALSFVEPVPTTRLPTDEEIDLLRRVIDPDGRGAREIA